MRLSTALKLMRATERIGVREQAKAIGISTATLSRIENGKDASFESSAKVIIYLFTSPPEPQKKV